MSTHRNLRMNVHKIAAVLAKGVKWVWSRRAEATVKEGARRAHRLADEIEWPQVRDRYRADDVTSDPVTVVWQGGTGDLWEITVNPYMGAVIVNGRVYQVDTLASNDVHSGMYRELNTEGGQ